MKAIILAAGRGSRMGKLTEDMPKCLVQLDGKPLLKWQMDALNGAGITEIGIVKGYMSYMLNEPGIKYFENHRWSETNMVVSLCYAEEWLKSDTCIISYSDIVYTDRAVSKLINAKGDIVITYDRNWLELWQRRFENPLSDAETFLVNDKGCLIEIGSKAKSLDEIEGQYMGLLKLTPEGWKQIKDFLSSLNSKECDCIDITSLLSKLTKSGVVINTIRIDDSWFEVDNENDLNLYNSLIKNPEYSVYAKKKRIFGALEKKQF